MADYYELLGVSRDAKTAAIRKAYFALARDRHPDRVTDPAAKPRAEAEFTELTAAFNTLGNDKTRAAYDAELAKPQVGPPEEQARQAYEGALAAAKAKDFPKAVELLSIAVHLAPQEARYHEALGRNLATNPGWMRKAIDALETAARLAPGSATPHLELARLYLGQGLKIRARRAVAQASRLAPENAEVRKIAADVEASS
jgi:DnaJ-class molecular chaperone